MVESLQNEVCVAVAAAQDHTVFLTETYDVFLFTAVSMVEKIVKHDSWPIQPDILSPSLL